MIFSLNISVKLYLNNNLAKKLLVVGRGHSTQVAFVLLFHQPQIQIPKTSDAWNFKRSSENDVAYRVDGVRTQKVRAVLRIDCPVCHEAEAVPKCS